jgi:hypothetical protein
VVVKPGGQPFAKPYGEGGGSYPRLHDHRLLIAVALRRRLSRSRAFIDRILALSGPDGGVVGGEDGVSTPRRLKVIIPTSVNWRSNASLDLILFGPEHTRIEASLLPRPSP